MIDINGYTLNLERYCEYCPDFEVEQNTIRYDCAQATHILRCEHADRCKNIATILREEMANNAESNEKRNV